MSNESIDPKNQHLALLNEDASTKGHTEILPSINPIPVGPYPEVRHAAPKVSEIDDAPEASAIETAQQVAAPTAPAEDMPTTPVFPIAPGEH